MLKDEIVEKVFNLCRSVGANVPLEVFNTPYEILISTVMSARTNDDTTLPAANRLFDKAPNIYKLAELQQSEIESLIYPVGFYKTKAKNIALLARQLIDDYDGKVPDKIEELVKLSGVGQKTANLVLNRAFGKNVISVDTHVHYISNLLGWVNTKTPTDTEIELMKVLPEKYWNEVNTLFVSLGRQLKTRQKVVSFLSENGLIETKKP